MPQLFSKIVKAAPSVCGKLSLQLKLNERSAGYSLLDEDCQLLVMSGLIKLLNGKDRVMDISPLGGASKAGAMVMDYSKALSDSNVDFYIIDQSVTGMFERKTRVGL